MDLEESHSTPQFSPNHRSQTPNSLKTQNVENQEMPTITKSSIINWPLLILNCSIMAIGVVGGPLLTRLYYIHGGNRKWLVSCTQTAGFPVLLFPLTSLYILHSKKNRLTIPASNMSSTTSFFMQPKLFFASASIGIVLGLVNFMYSLGLSNLPVTTSAILCATQLAFIACFSRLIVKQKFTAFSINAVVLMTLGSILLGIGSGGDRSSGVTKDQYLLGFLLTLGSAALAGLMMPLIEFSYSKATPKFNYSTLLQFQFISGMFSTIFNIIGMLINKDFQAIPKEASAYGLQSGMYIFVLVACTVIWQLATLGGAGVILYRNSLFSGVFSSVLLPFTEIAAVIAYHESFTGEKGMALGLYLWGFANYFYGEYKIMKAADHSTTVTEPPKEDAANA